MPRLRARLLASGQVPGQGRGSTVWAGRVQASQEAKWTLLRACCLGLSRAGTEGPHASP